MDLFFCILAKISSFPVSNIRNKYVAKVKPGEHSLVIPLGAKAEINIEKNTSDIPTGIYKLELMDIAELPGKRISLKNNTNYNIMPKLSIFMYPGEYRCAPTSNTTRRGDILLYIAILIYK